MATPVFTAEISLYRSDTPYSIGNAQSSTAFGSSVMPAQFSCRDAYGACTSVFGTSFASVAGESNSVPQHSNLLGCTFVSIPGQGQERYRKDAVFA
jgi:hypothetical protein